MSDNPHLIALRTIIDIVNPPPTITGPDRRSKAERLAEVERVAREAVEGE